MAVPAVATFEQTGRSVTASLGDTNITRTFFLKPYAAYPTIVEALMGSVRRIGRRLIRTPPHRDRYQSWCYCQDVRVDMMHGEAVSSGGSFATVLAALNAVEAPTAGAKVTAIYKPWPGADRDQVEGAQGPNVTPQQERDLADETWNFSAKNITLPGDRYRWDADAETLITQNVQAVKTIPHIDYTLTRHFLIRLPFDALTKLAGRINENTFRVANNVWPAECVRLDGANAKRKISSVTGLQYYDLTMRWAIQPTFDFIDDGASDDEGYVGWNRFYRPSTGLWDYAALVGDTSKRVYKLDTGVSQTILGTPVTGFDLLFHPLAT